MDIPQEFFSGIFSRKFHWKICKSQLHMKKERSKFNLKFLVWKNIGWGINFAIFVLDVLKKN